MGHRPPHSEVRDINAKADTLKTEASMERPEDDTCPLARRLSVDRVAVVHGSNRMQETAAGPSRYL
jgi:hypothetical protein